MIAEKNTADKSAFVSALLAQGFSAKRAEITEIRANDFLGDVIGEKTVDDLFVQKNPKFAEGSAPVTTSERGKLVDQALHAMLALPSNTMFKVGLDGFGQHAGGLIVLDVANDYEHVLVVKGDPYNKGKVGVIGGQGADVDKGDDLACALREKGSEVGGFEFDTNRLVELVHTTEWRETDSRLDGYWIKGTFYVYLATSSEVSTLREGYAAHVARTGGDPEIFSLASLKRREVLEHVRDGRMGYADQSQAFAMVALCITKLRRAFRALLAIGIDEPTDSELWGFAKVLAAKEYKDLIGTPDWQANLDIENFGIAMD